MTVRHCTLALAIAGALVAVVLEGCGSIVQNAFVKACQPRTSMNIERMVKTAQASLEKQLGEACKSLVGDANATLNGNQYSCDAAIKTEAEDNITKLAEKEKAELQKNCEEWVQNQTNMSGAMSMLGNMMDLADEFINNQTEGKSAMSAYKKDLEALVDQATTTAKETVNNVKNKASETKEAATKVEIDSSGGGPIFRKGGTEGAVSVVAGVGLASLAAVGAMVLALKRLGRERHGMALLPDQSQSEEDGFEVAVQEAK